MTSFICAISNEASKNLKFISLKYALLQMATNVFMNVTLIYQLDFSYLITDQDVLLILVLLTIHVVKELNVKINEAALSVLAHQDMQEIRM